MPSAVQKLFCLLNSDLCIEIYSEQILIVNAPNGAGRSKVIVIIIEVRSYDNIVSSGDLSATCPHCVRPYSGPDLQHSGGCDGKLRQDRG